MATIAQPISGDVVLRSRLLPDFCPDECRVVLTEDLGSLDAPTFLPAGSCFRFELEGVRPWPSQTAVIR